MTNEKMARTWREINLNAIEHNIKKVQKHIKPHTIIMGVVKADGYGHGAVEVSKVMLKNGVSRLAVAEVNEAIELRNAGIDVPILILSHGYSSDAVKIVEFDITAAVFDFDYAQNISKIAQEFGKTAKIHIKLDTGMTRVGFNLTDDDLEEIVKISKLPNIFIEGVFSHFACADTEDKSVTDAQFEAFTGFVEKLKSHGIDIPVRHIANSAAILRFPEYQLEMVRSGIISYGYLPSGEDIYDDTDFIPAMTLKTRIMRINSVEKGIGVSYGHTYKTENTETKIATVPIGYADGYARTLSNKAQMTVNGKIVPLIGRICMDQCMIDVTSVNNINVGDEVIVFGDGKNSTVTADDIASLIGTISYEVLCFWGSRVPRVYIKDGAIW